MNNENIGTLRRASAQKMLFSADYTLSMHKQAVFIGDVHGRHHWQSVVKTWLDHADLIVFLGDYLDTHDPRMTSERINANFRAIIKLKQQHPDKIRLHLGNHDFYYFYNNPLYIGSGYREDIADEWHDLLQKNRDLFRLASRFDQTLASHAGFTNWWIKQFQHTYEKKMRHPLDMNDLVPALNACLKTVSPDQFTNLIATVGLKRGGFSPSGGPIWCDQRELQADPLVGFNQTVGHTPQQGGRYTQTLASGGEWLTFNDLGESLITQPFVLLYENAD
nr:hypothetical protein A6C57_01505 [Fibrella sp. ES10-3-2-2]